MKVAAVVIWYNPSQEFVKNILTYSKHVEKVIIVDNSTFENRKFLLEYQNFEYIPLNENKGIAEALNIGLQCAIESGMDWALTMDQDSWFDEEDILRFLDPNAKHFNESGVAIFAPALGLFQPDSITDMTLAITSGSLTNLSIFQSTSGFNENLFIDEVDHDYCYRLIRAGHRILRLNRVFLHHTLGSPISKNILGWNMVSSNHNAIRKYYITRNLFYISRQYPEFNRRKIRPVLRMIFNIFFVEDSDKKSKFINVIMGIWDFKSGKMGKKIEKL